MDYEVASRLLEAWGQGDRAALDRLMGLVYHELHRTATALLRNESAAQRTRPTSLVHDLFLELQRQGRLEARGEQHFFAIAAFLMRQILVKNARVRRAAKRAPGLAAQSLSEESIRQIADRGIDWNDSPELLLALNDALVRLEQFDAVKASIVDLRFFGDLSIEATAEALNLSPSTVKRHWAVARVWLYEQLRSVDEARTLATD